MVRMSWKVYTGLILLVSSAVLGALHALIFKDPQNLFFYLALDVVFVPVQVLLVSIIIERLLSERENQSMMKKLNMVIGAFFSEVGNRLMREMGTTCVDFPVLEENLSIDTGWDKAEYTAAADFVKNYECRFDPKSTHLENLKDFLIVKRRFILALLQNPNLLEHEKFTNLLWAVCHLTEELEARQDFSVLPPSDLLHLQGDIQRAFGKLIREWLSYMRHLKQSYPYMYSLCVRMNPFNPAASPVVGDD